MITKIDKNECRIIRDAIVNALKDVENTLGLEINLGSGRFDEDCLTFNNNFLLLSKALFQAF